MMFTGKTKSGFVFCIPEKRIHNMELLLDDDAKRKLYDHVRDEDGTVPVEAVMAEIYDMLQNGKQAKNS